MSPLTFDLSTATRKYAQTSSYRIPGQHFQETVMALSYSNQEHTHMGDYIIPVLKQQTRLLLRLQRRIFCSDIQHCLDCSDAQTLWHLAAIIPSELNNYFLRFFLRDLKHKGTLYSGCHLTFLKTLRYLRCSPLFSNNIARN